MIERLEFTIDKTGPKKFSKKCNLKSISGLNIEIDGYVRADDYAKIFRETIDGRSWLEKKLCATPLIGNYFYTRFEDKIISNGSFVSITLSGMTLIQIPTSRIPLDSGLGSRFVSSIAYGRSLKIEDNEEVELSIEWTVNPNLSKPVKGAIVVGDSQC
jgi:hypothetical protein